MKAAKSVYYDLADSRQSIDFRTISLSIRLISNMRPLLKCLPGPEKV